MHLFQVITDLGFGAFGIVPRQIWGLKGILFAPLIHGDWAHLISNTIPLAALMSILFVFYKRVAMKSFLLIYLLTGLAVWIFGSIGRMPTYHIGASGIVYGLVAFVFWSGVFRRNLKSIALALVILVMYSGYFYGILPGQPGISWESHLFGGVAGIIIAWAFKHEVEKQEEPQYLQEDESQDYFLRRDTFERTREERESDSLSDWWSNRT